MNDKKLLVKKYAHKAIIITIALTAIFLILRFILLVIGGLYLGGAFDDPPPSRSEIFHLVESNIKTFDDAIYYIILLIKI